MAKKTLEERFWAKVATGEPAACWEWHATRRNGYGRIKVDGKLKSAHRIAYQLYHGDIPPGMKVCHRCDNPSCVNPAHLFLGKQKDNVQDMIEKGRYHPVCGEKQGNAKLTAAQVRRIRAQHSAGSSYTQLGAMYKIHRSTIGRVVTRKTWKHI